ncbi:MAG: (Na+)-NQR maturation NqrM [Chromatiaceae bacterium]|nr:(Na+)-NQR maturation NqrM [Gammaproteobacteria bacterium]MCP5298115.1 (Na+)-NQR maturation NqrM [Chromatiaceae bacterium]MCP5423345.1 (Na+)-NQR maturation NqrM [Chromatiaceae bacterium]
MIEWLFSLLILLLAVAGMAIGVIRGRHAISGSCGGLNRIPGVESDCGGVCRATCERRRRIGVGPPVSADSGD